MAERDKTAKIIKKANMEKFIGNLSGEYLVFIPSADEEGVSFRKFSNKAPALTEYSNSYLPPAKCFLFPPVWKKFIPCNIEDMEDQGENKAIFGVRPCDAQSITLLDRVLHDNAFYRNKRSRLLIIVAGCNFPLDTCFCTSVKGGPFSVKGADIFITDMGDDLIVEDISGKGAKFLADIFNATPSDMDRREEIARESHGMINETLQLDGLPEKLEMMDKVFERDGVWRKLSEGCSDCGLCTSICPTCHCCFVLDDIMDMVIGEIGAKAAEDWDPCMFNIFMSAGLSGPPPEGHQRLQRRIMDKFCHAAKALGQPFCVGCGRCIINCKEQLNLIETLTALNNLNVA
ncbi:MAG: hypothetical protein GXP46_03055 [Deferribacteres bacterium]|nr:hypothetical protein [Deferribacteres bacterium]